MTPNTSPTLLDKWKLVRAAAHDRQFSAGDIAVLIALCDRYGSKGNPNRPALAGHALLGSMAGLSRRAAISSTQRLITAGFIEVVDLGAGTRGTTYSLNFARGERNDTTSDTSSSGDLDNTTEVKPTTPLAPPSGDLHFTESPLTEAPLQGRLRKEGLRDAPSASAGPGGAASPGADGFEDLWRAYDVRKDRKAARAAYNRLNPDAQLQEQMVAAAHTWKEGAGTIPRKSLVTWLDEERWHEDPPKPFQQPRKPVAATGEPANDNMQAKSIMLWPLDQSHTVVIDRVERIENDNERLTRLHLTEGKNAWVHDMVEWRASDGPKNYGNRMTHEYQWRDLLRATGTDLTGGIVRVTLREGPDDAPPNVAWRAA